MVSVSVSASPIIHLIPLMKKMFMPGLLAASVFCCLNARAETEWGSTGDLREFRFKGEPIGITTSIRMSSPDGSQTGQAQLQTPGRTGGRLEFTGNVGFGTAAGGGGRRRSPGRRSGRWRRRAWSKPPGAS